MGTVANLAVRISANAQDFERTVATMSGGFGNIEKGLQGAADKIDAFHDRMRKIQTAVGTIFAFEFIAAGIQRIGDWGGKILDFSNRLGISTEAVQRFKFAAEQSGSSIETIGRAIEFANRGMAKGESGFVGALNSIGLSMEQLRGLSPDQVFLKMAQAIDKTTDAVTKDQAAQVLLGKSGQELQQILPNLIADFERAPVAIEGAAQAADALGDAWDELKAKGDAALGTMALIVVEGSKYGLLGDTFRAVGEAWAGANKMLGSDGKGSIATDINLTRDAASELDPRLRSVKDSTAELKQQQREAAAALREANKEAAAYRQTMNWLGEEMMKADRAQMDYFANLGKGIMLMRETNNPQLLLQSTSLPTEALMQLPGQVKETLQVITVETTSIWSDMLFNLQQDSAYAFASMITGAMSFHEGFVSIWHSIRNSLTNILADILNNVIGGFIRGVGSMLSGGSFGGGFGNIGSMIGGVLGIGGGGGGAASTAASAGAAAAGGGGGFMSGLGALLTNPWTAVAGGAAALIGGIWKGGLFRGGEEALKVNPARDEWFRQFGDVGNKGTGGANWNLAAKLTEMGFGEGGGQIFANLQQADTMKEYEAAVRAVEEALASGSQQATADTAALAQVAATGSMAVDGLAASIANLAAAASSASAPYVDPGSLAGMTSGEMLALMGGGNPENILRPNDSLSASDAVALPGLFDSTGITADDVVGFAGGSGGFRNFGRGTLAMLHGTEAVVRPEDMRSAAGGIQVHLSGMVYGSEHDLENAITRGVMNAVERGGPNFQKWRKLTNQASGAL